MDILGHLQQGADTCTTPTYFLSLGSLFFTLPVCKMSPLIFTPWACDLSSSPSKSVVSLWPLPTTYTQLPSLRMTSGRGYGDKGSLQVSRCTAASSPPPPSNYTGNISPFTNNYPQVVGLGVFLLLQHRTLAWTVAMLSPSLLPQWCSGRSWCFLITYCDLLLF